MVPGRLQFCTTQVWYLPLKSCYKCKRKNLQSSGRCDCHVNSAGEIYCPKVFKTEMQTQSLCFSLPKTWRKKSTFGKKKIWSLHKTDQLRADSLSSKKAGIMIYFPTSIWPLAIIKPGLKGKWKGLRKAKNDSLQCKYLSSLQHAWLFIMVVIEYRLCWKTFNTVSVRQGNL